MRQYLLDTHTLIWAIVDAGKLSRTALNILQDVNNQLFVSVVSFWEIAIKHAKGKLYIENFEISRIPDYCKRLGIETVALTSEDTAY
jgi:PIN domain nuclease of toxin-antitoxin system